MKRHGSASLLAIHLLERRLMNEDTMLKPALIGGVLLGVLSALPLINYFNCFCCAWVIAGGVVAARLYVKDSAVPVTLGRGLTVGLLTGVIGTIVFALFSIPLILMSHGGSGIMEQLKQAAEQVPNMPPQTREAIESLASQGGISTFIYIVGFIITLVLYSLVAMIGGAIGVAIFEKRKTGSGLSEPPPYRPPADLPPPPPPTDAV
jgi:hypothetical protein